MNWSDVSLNPDINKPLYQQIAQRLRQLIRTRQLKPGEKLPSTQDLQSFFRVSIITVEAGINLLVKEKYLHRRPRLGTFVSPVPGHRQLSSDRDDSSLPPMINVVFSEISAADIYWYSVLHTLEMELQSQGYRMLFTQLVEHNQVPVTLTAGCAGVILCGYNSTRLVKMLNQQKIPLVLVGSLDEPDQLIDQLDAVVHDDIHRAMISTRHLIDLGHPRLACVTGPAGSQLEDDHRQGFRSAAAAAGLNDDQLSFISVPQHTIDEGIKAGYKLLCTAPRPTAVFASDDRLAAGIIHTAAKLGIHVPDDLSVIGCGGMEFGGIITPRLTTTVSFPENCARVAVRKLLDQRGVPGHKREKAVIQISEIAFGESTRLYRAPEKTNV